MLTTDEKKFLEYWEQNRKLEKSFLQQFRFVVPIALILGVAFLLNIFTGWYTRANMVANSQFSPMVLIVAIVIIAVFCSVFYKRHRWDLNEQRYIELNIRKNKKSVQQVDAVNSQIDNQ
jgi:membrane protein YdbS with pleckstrin-like domain